MTASINAAKLTSDDVKEMSETVLGSVLSLERRLTKLALYMVENGEPVKAGQLAVMVGVCKQFSTYLDSIAAYYNSRPLREALHGVREAEKHQTYPQQQMRLLQDEGP